jgi:hypothetical protein
MLSSLLRFSKATFLFKKNPFLTSRQFVVAVVDVVVVAFTTVVGALFESDPSVTNHAKAFFPSTMKRRPATPGQMMIFVRYKIADKTKLIARAFQQKSRAHFFTSL